MYASWLYMFRFFDDSSLLEWSPMTLQHLQGLLTWLLSTLPMRSLLTLLSAPSDSFPLVYLLSLKHAQLSPSSGLCPCSSLPDIFLPQFFEWLIHSHVSGLSLDVICSGKPPALPLSHHSMCVLQSIDLHNVTCIFI